MFRFLSVVVEGVKDGWGVTLSAPLSNEQLEYVDHLNQANSPCLTVRDVALAPPHCERGQSNANGSLFFPDILPEGYRVFSPNGF